MSGHFDRMALPLKTVFFAHIVRKNHGNANQRRGTSRQRRDAVATVNGGTPSLRFRVVFHVVQVADGVGVGVGDEAKPVETMP